MRISKKKWQALEKRVADLEAKVQSQQLSNDILWEFCESVANAEKLSLVSYQQLHSPSADSAEKVRELIIKAFERRTKDIC